MTTVAEIVKTRTDAAAKVEAARATYLGIIVRPAAEWTEDETTAAQILAAEHGWNLDADRGIVRSLVKGAEKLGSSLDPAAMARAVQVAFDRSAQAAQRVDQLTAELHAARVSHGDAMGRYQALGSTYESTVRTMNEHRELTEALRAHLALDAEPAPVTTKPTPAPTRSEKKRGG